MTRPISMIISMPRIRPSVVLMNPPFSALAKVEGRVADAAARHVASALSRLAEGGRLVAITGASLSPENPSWRDAFIRLQEQGRIVFSAAIDGRVYARHGTSVDTRLTVIDRVPADDPEIFPACAGKADDVATLLGWIESRGSGARPLQAAVFRAVRLRPRSCARARDARVSRACRRNFRRNPPAAGCRCRRSSPTRPATGCRRRPAGSPRRSTSPTASSRSASPARSRIRPPSCSPPRWPSVAPPKPSYRPLLPERLVIDEGLLSDAQLESVIYAGEAHSGHLAGAWTVDETCDVVSAAPDDARDAVRFRRGWFLGDGTGGGKGRQVAGILLDNWLKGRRRALWISKSDKLLEDAQRDWSALGQERLLVTPLSRFRQGTPIRLAEGILFTTYATLRSQEREGKKSRIAAIADQIVELAGARTLTASSSSTRRMPWPTPPAAKGERGDQAASQQGRAGLRLQHALPDARVVYVSATGATAVREPRLCAAPRHLGRRGFPVRQPRRVRRRRSRRAASPPWKCSPATSSRSASTPPARSPTTASNTSCSSTR